MTRRARLFMRVAPYEFLVSATKRPIDRCLRMQRGCVEDRHGAIFLPYQQRDLRAAKNDPLRAALRQPPHDCSVLLARLFGDEATA
jgi:hypothetical protein